MSKKQSKPTILKELKEKLSRQDYSKKTIIEGVKIIELKTFGGEDGYFLELGRLQNGKFKELPEFEAAQISYSTVLPGGVKAWHLHLNQEDLWFVPPDNQLLVGLKDIRENSPTKDLSMRLILGSYKALLLLIPRGVAHGCANISSQPSAMVYFTNQQFSAEDPDEYRLPSDTFGADFWEMTKG